MGPRHSRSRVGVMNGVLRALHSPDTPTEDLRDFSPHDAASFVLMVQAFVGPSDGPGEESFEFVVCTALGLAAKTLPKGFAFERLLLLESWNAALVERAIGDLVRHASGASWPEVAEKIARFARWEFEDSSVD